MNYGEFVSQWTTKLEGVGIDTARLDVEILVSELLDVERFRLTAYPDEEISDEDILRLNRALKRREKREPVAYILGMKEFYSLDFIVNKNVLIPRPETELLVDMAIYHGKNGGRALDIGTGSGAIAVSLKYNRRDLTVVATDISEKSLTIARKNSKEILGGREIKFLSGSLFDPIKQEKFDLIISNPPYVSPAVRENLEEELEFEPEHALYAEDFGRKILKEIIEQASDYLSDDGVLLLEIGNDQGDYIKTVATQNGFAASILQDYAKMPRVAVLKR